MIDYNGRGLDLNKNIFFILLLFLAGAVFLVEFNTVLATPLVEDSWYSKTQMGQARTNLGVIAVEGKIHAIGGAIALEAYPGVIVDTHEVYDPLTDTWTTITPIPTPRSHFAITTYQNKIYCIGGRAGVVDNLIYNTVWSYSYTLTNAVEVYDTTTKSWSTVAPMPYNASNIKAATIEAHIFVLLGPHLLKYDPLTDLWEEKTQMPNRPQSSSSAQGPYPVLFVIDDKLIVTSEFNSGPKVMVYDPKKDAWQEETVGPMIYCDGVGLVTSGIYAPQSVYFLGPAPGSIFREILTNQAYDFANDTWLIGKAMPNLRLGFGAAIVDDIIYVIGGYTGGYTYGAITQIERSALNEAYVPFGYRSVPTIGLVTPLNQPYNISEVSLEFVVDRPTSLLYYCIDGGANVTIWGNTTISGLSNGAYTVTVFAEDHFGNTGVSETRLFTVASNPEPKLSTPIIETLGVLSGLIAITTLFLYLKRRHTTQPPRQHETNSMSKK